MSQVLTDTKFKWFKVNVLSKALCMPYLAMNSNISTEQMETLSMSWVKKACKWTRRIHKHTLEID